VVQAEKHLLAGNPRTSPLKRVTKNKVHFETQLGECLRNVNHNQDFSYIYPISAVAKVEPPNANPADSKKKHYSDLDAYMADGNQY